MVHRLAFWGCCLGIMGGCGIDSRSGGGEVPALPASSAPAAYVAALDGSTPPSTSPQSACGGSDVEVSGGGYFSGSTCGCSDAGDLACGEQPPGRPEASYRFTVPPGRWGCKVTLAAGLSYQITGDGVATSCGYQTGPVDAELPVEERPGILFGGGASGRTYFLSVETAGVDPCGDYWVEVHCQDNLF